MKHLGNLTEDQIIDFAFSTHKADGTPETLSGAPAVAVYKANSTTQSTDGVTLTVDFDGVTGLNHVRIDTSAHEFYAVANDYSVVITAGTVDGVSVAGTVLATFSIENRFQEADVVKWLGVAPLALSAQQVQAVVPTSQQVVLANAAHGGAVASITLQTPIAADMKLVKTIDADTAITARVDASTAATNVGTLLNRLGAWTGSGINTVLGAFRALVGKKAALTPTDLTADSVTFDNTTDSLEALRDRGDAAWITATGFSTHSAADVVTALGAGDTLTALADKTTLDAIAADVAGLDGGAIPTAAQNADALLDRANGVETGVTPRQALQRMGAVIAGVASGAGTGTETFVGLDGETTRAVVAVDSSGNRTAITYT